MVLFWWQVLVKMKQVLRFSVPVALKVAVTEFETQSQKSIYCFVK